MTADTSDAEFARRALGRVPAVTPAAGFEGAALAAFDRWNAKRATGPAPMRALRGFCDLVWPGAPRWALAGAFTVSLLLGVGLGAALPAPDEDRMAFSLEQPPGITLLSSDSGEDL